MMTTYSWILWLIIPWVLSLAIYDLLKWVVKKIFLDI